MKTNYPVFAFLLLGSFISYSQKNHRVDPIYDRQFGVINEMRPQPAGTKGTVYLNDEWIETTLYLKENTLPVDSLNKVSTKLDLKTSLFEISTEGGVKVLEGSNVRAFRWMNPSNGEQEMYVNCDQFTYEGTSLIGFCKTYGDKVKLVKHNYLDVVKADYNVALNVGSREDKILKKTKLYFLKDNQLVECSKKSAFNVMADKEKEVKQFIQKNDISLSKEEGLRQVVTFYNSVI